MYEESLRISEPESSSSDRLISVQSYAYAKLGRKAEAQVLLKRWKEQEKTRYISNYQVALTYVALGEKDLAFAELEKSYKERNWFLQRIKVDPFLDPLRDDARFTDLVKRLGL